MVAGWESLFRPIPDVPFGRPGRWGRLHLSESFPSSLSSAQQKSSYPMLEAGVGRPAPGHRVESW